MLTWNTTHRTTRPAHSTIRDGLRQLLGQRTPAHLDVYHHREGHPDPCRPVQLPSDKRCRTAQQVLGLHHVCPYARQIISSADEPHSYAYMIDNVVLLITGTLHERDTHELLERCHPLGVFDTMPALCVATNVEELYQSVLVETPIGAFQANLPLSQTNSLQHRTSATVSRHRTWMT